MNGHLLNIRQSDPELLKRLLRSAQDLKTKITSRQAIPQFSGRTLGLLFFENSTRTRVSFEQAANYLGVRTSLFSSAGTSVAKGETLKDTILTLRHERLDALVMRHPMSGAVNVAAHFFGGPVVNAGDGQHEHPTQALGDALTIMEHKGNIEGLTVAIVGDVRHSRVARSNAWLLSRLGADVRFVGPKTLIPENTSLLPGKVFHSIGQGIADADVVMCLRLQKERMIDGQLSSLSEYASQYQINRESLYSASPDCIVMHPGPMNRGVEIDDLAADGSSSVIREQVENCVFARVAVLAEAFSTLDSGTQKVSA